MMAQSMLLEVNVGTLKSEAANSISQEAKLLVGFMRLRPAAWSTFMGMALNMIPTTHPT